MEENYKSYKNLYTVNPLALNKHQLQEERDRRRHLSYKFSLTQQSEFSWSAPIYGNLEETVDALRKSLLELEAKIAKPFMHANWPAHRSRWLRAVGFCKRPPEFAIVLLIFEACMKPVLFNSIWHENHGW